MKVLFVFSYHFKIRTTMETFSNIHGFKDQSITHTTQLNAHSLSDFSVPSTECC